VTGPAAEHDDDKPGITHYSVAELEGLAKAIIRQAPDKAHRWRMWAALTEAMEDAKEASAEYPWDDPRALTSITPESAKRAFLAMLTAVPDIP